MTWTLPRELTLPADHHPPGRLRLVPLSLEHAPGLFAATDDPEVWRLRPDPKPRSVEEMRVYLGKRLAEVPGRGGKRWPMTLTIRDTHEIVGTSGYLELDPVNRSLEIGATIVAPKWQRTFVNTEAKLLLLTHAFEGMGEGGCVRVFFKVDTRNTRSMEAVKRIGAVPEGVLRKSRINHDGYIRDTAVFSIIEAEWHGGVKARLIDKLRR